MVSISLSADIDRLSKKLNEAATKQLPFATAKALTAVANRVKLVEEKNIKSIFPTATPFTMRSVFRLPASKNNLVAVVDVKDIAAKYLAPFQTGGPHDLGTKKGLLTPIKQGVNQYGNLPAGTVADLKSRHDVFIGKVKNNNGIWQRTTDIAKMSLVKQNKRKRFVREKGVNVSGKLKLLIRFSDPKTVTQQLRWDALAIGCIKSRWEREFNSEMKKALATAK